MPCAQTCTNDAGKSDTQDVGQVPDTGPMLDAVCNVFIYITFFMGVRGAVLCCAVVRTHEAGRGTVSNPLYSMLTPAVLGRYPVKTVLGTL